MTFLYLSILSYLLPVIAGIRKKYTLLWQYAATGFIFDIVVTLTKRVFHLNYHVLTNIFVITEFTFISFIFRGLLFKTKTNFYLYILVLTVLYSVHCLLNTINELDTFGYCIFLLIYIVYAIAGFYSILKKQEIVFIEKSPVFWTNVAFLVYASGNFIAMLFTNYMRSNVPELYIFIWAISFKVFNVFKNLFLAKALSCMNNDDKPS